MHSYHFRWGKDIFIMRANWGNAEDKIMVNGQQIYGTVGEYNHSPRKAAKCILEEAAIAEGLNPLDPTIQSKIEKILNGLD